MVKTLARISLGMLLAIAVIASVVPALAFQGGGPQRKEVKLDFDESYDVFIGNAGIFVDNSKMLGTLVMHSEEAPATTIWHKWTQHILDFQVYDVNGKPFQWVYGNVLIYFNLDRYQYLKWVEEESNMSIWYQDKLNGGWKKCTTHWEPVTSLDHGRLWCLARYYTRYALGYTQPTLLMKLIKLGTITITPTPSQTPTNTPAG
ncbi:MAG TPA: hypothetical protein VI703_11010 [Anaerolineales bacterium]|jgi:hypothetical protein|nr:hypothetical protein [Anaerolineales bacterium]